MYGVNTAYQPAASAYAQPPFHSRHASDFPASLHTSGIRTSSPNRLRRLAVAGACGVAALAGLSIALGPHNLFTAPVTLPLGLAITFGAIYVFSRSGRRSRMMGQGGAFNSYTNRQRFA
jgi:hypothetical protein